MSPISLNASNPSIPPVSTAPSTNATANQSGRQANNLLEASPTGIPHLP